MIQDGYNKTIENALNKICGHKLFANSPTYTVLLKYLVEKAIASEGLNEVTIGSDLYGIDYATDINNGTVRSYMFKLRKKLDEYYKEEGKDDAIVFDIKKGQYNLAFLSLKDHQLNLTDKKKEVKLSLRNLKMGGFVAIVLMLGFIASKISLDKTEYVWESFFQKNNSNIVVISDQYMLTEAFENNELHPIVYGEINCEKDFIRYKQEYPDRKISITDYTLMSKMAPYAVKTLTKYFIENESDFSLKLESNLTYEDITEKNILFIGQHKTMTLSKSMFLKTSKGFSIFKDGFKYKSEHSEKIYNTSHGKNGKIEYALVSFTSLNPGKTALYFVSNNDIGVMATVRKFTDKDWLKDFYKQLPDQAQFNALFEVSGIQRNDVSCKLVELEILTSPK